MISVVIPIYNEAESIESLAKRLTDELTRLAKPYEILFVDDGSTDQTQEKITRIARADSKCIYLRLSRRFGQSAALAAGIDHSHGTHIVTMDADGQNDPSDIAQLLAKIEADGSDVVCGWRKNRQDNWLRSAASGFANGVVNSITGIHLHDYGCTLRIYRRSIIEDLQLMGDMHRLLPAYLAWRGARIGEIEVRHHPRQYGYSKYGLISRTLRVLLDAFLLKFYFSYFSRPMHFFGSAAFFCLALSITVEGFVIWRKIVLQGDWISPMFFLGLFFASLALIFLFMGTLADLIVRNYAQIKNIKPYHLDGKDTR